MADQQPGGRPSRTDKLLTKVAKIVLSNGLKKEGRRSVHDRPYFNPEELMAHKREWAKRFVAGCGSQDPQWSEHLFEHFAIVGLSPNMSVRAVTTDIKTYQKVSKVGGAGMSLTPDAPKDKPQYAGLKGPVLPAEVLYSFPSQLPPDLAAQLAAFCFPHGVRPELLERTPSMSALNEVVYSQPYQTHDDHSFVLLMKVTDPTGPTPRTLYGVCCLMRELVHRPPALARDDYPSCTLPLSRYMVAAPRCYVLLTHYPFFALHFRVLQTILGLERLDRMTALAEELAGGIPSAPLSSHWGSSVAGSDVTERGTTVNMSPHSMGSPGSLGLGSVAASPAAAAAAAYMGGAGRSPGARRSPTAAAPSEPQGSTEDSLSTDASSTAAAGGRGASAAGPPTAGEIAAAAAVGLARMASAKRALEASLARAGSGLPEASGSPAGAAAAALPSGEGAGPSVEPQPPAAEPASPPAATQQQQLGALGAAAAGAAAAATAAAAAVAGGAQPSGEGGSSFGSLEGTYRAGSPPPAPQPMSPRTAQRLGALEAAAAEAAAAAAAAVAEAAQCSSSPTAALRSPRSFRARFGSEAEDAGTAASSPATPPEAAASSLPGPAPAEQPLPSQSAEAAAAGSVPGGAADMGAEDTAASSQGKEGSGMGAEGPAAAEPQESEGPEGLGAEEGEGNAGLESEEASSGFYSVQSSAHPSFTSLSTVLAGAAAAAAGAGLSGRASPLPAAAAAASGPDPSLAPAGPEEQQQLSIDLESMTRAEPAASAAVRGSAGQELKGSGGGGGGGSVDTQQPDDMGSSGLRSSASLPPSVDATPHAPPPASASGAECPGAAGVPAAVLAASGGGGEARSPPQPAAELVLLSQEGAEEGPASAAAGTAAAAAAEEAAEGVEEGAELAAAGMAVAAAAGIMAGAPLSTVGSSEQPLGEPSFGIREVTAAAASEGEAAAAAGACTPPAQRALPEAHASAAASGAANGVAGGEGQEEGAEAAGLVGECRPHGSPVKVASLSSIAHVEVKVCTSSYTSPQPSLTATSPARSDILSATPLNHTRTLHSAEDPGSEGPSTSGTPGELPSLQAGRGRQQEIVRVTAANLDLSRPLEALDLLSVYYASVVPQPGQVFEFQPDPGLQSIAFERPDLLEALRDLGLRPTAASLPDIDAAQNLGAWTVAALCRSMSLDNILTYLTAALLEQQMVVFCPNIGLLCGVVLSLVPMLLPFAWQSLLLPVLPATPLGLEIFEAPVPFVLGCLYKTSEVRPRCGGLTRVNVYKDRIKTDKLPALPSGVALHDALQGTYTELRRIGQQRTAVTRPVHMVSDAQRVLAECFLSTLQGYLKSLVADLKAYTITDVTADNDRVSVLLKDSWTESFPLRDRPFMRQFAETQMFAVYCDAVIDHIVR